jgi:hypothetical protein
MLRKTMIVLATAGTLTGGLTADAFALATARSSWNGLGAVAGQGGGSGGGAYTGGGFDRGHFGGPGGMRGHFDHDNRGFGRRSRQGRPGD